ncbi:membrane progestin receptor gamma-B-like isoform X1 [Acipenser ruthenus]|uniref:membrane progestin receptor gamma-B-like isoform X1 n=1 Tax=Acipenser ruthenus TaxID=7906 RepID=UPI0015614970|nr:membrane progestin receptor gamma-B-like isoform X1 [Acipenser ruthenus]XP_058851472.1 membrane progestin receptor gamma-B-like isoform X1 [Acipenser ruthenus]XP_058851473.1 membrane progestin receptor gamma-B-like isoform X1 [Acipenser ruthenus]
MLSLKLPRLFTINQVPKVYHEDSIIFGYRHPRSSAKDCIISVFQLTNETLNIWTHFLPTWYFLWNLLAVLYTLDVWNDAFSWPLIVFLVSCCIYPFTSSCAHTFSTMSPRARHVCFFFDYGALSLYSLGSAISYSAYVIPDQWINSTFHRCYVPIAVFNTIVCTGLACFSRLGIPFVHYNHDVIERFPELERPKLSKALRTLAFAYPYMFDNIPLFYRIFLCSGEGCTDNETNALHYRHTALAFLTCFLFTTHLPERLAPGSFDFFGHSHQLFHVCAVIGTHFQMKAIMMDKTLRRGWLMSHAPATTFTGTIAAVLACVTFNLCMILAFSLAACWKPDSSKKLRQEYATTTLYNQKAL